jgi:DNA-binding NarL/FixJ family response regulator
MPPESTKVDGMSKATDLAVAASGPDVRTGLRATLALRRLAETLEALQVANARRQGWSWQEIADALEVSKQAVHKKYADRVSGED